MSFRATAWAWEQQGMTATMRLVLLCLCNHAHEKTGICWPKQADIATETGFSPRTVRDALAALEEANLILRKARFTTGRMRMNDDIWVLFSEATIFAGRTAADSARAANGEISAGKEAPKGRERDAAQQTVTSQPVTEESSLRSESSACADPELLDDGYGDDEAVVDAEFVLLAPGALTEVTDLTVVVPDNLDPVEEAVLAYNAACEEFGWAPALKVSAQRRKAIKARLAEHGLDGWRYALEKARRSPLCRGETGRASWRFNIDFMAQEGSLLKLIEGAYDGNPRGGSGRPTMAHILQASALSREDDDDDPRF